MSCPATVFANARLSSSKNGHAKVAGVGSPSITISPEMLRGSPSGKTTSGCIQCFTSSPSQSGHCFPHRNLRQTSNTFLSHLSSFEMIAFGDLILFMREKSCQLSRLGQQPQTKTPRHLVDTVAHMFGVDQESQRQAAIKAVLPTGVAADSSTANP